MTETLSHHRAKRAAAGKGGRTEVPLPRGRKLDALSKTGKRATEIERSRHTTRLKAAIRRLRDSRAKQKVLRVPQRNFAKAVQMMRSLGVSGAVSNISGTQRQAVRKCRTRR